MKKLQIGTLALTALSASLLAACGSSGSGVAVSSPVNTNNNEAVRITGATYQAANQWYAPNAAYNTQASAALTLNAEDTKITSSNIARNISIANDNWYALISNSSTEEDKKITLANNANYILTTKLSSVFNGKYFIPSTKVTTNNILIPDSNVTPNKDSLTGTEVNVAMIDGRVNPDNSHFAKKPVNITVKSSTTSTSTSNKTLSSEGQHGTYVGLIIAGKRGANEPGIAPGVSLAYAEIQENQSDISSLFDSVMSHTFTNNKKVDIINNSYRVPAKNEQIAQPTTTADGKLTLSGYESIVSSVKKYTADPKITPLFVFSTGNYDYRKFLQDYVSKTYYEKVEEELKKEPNKNIDTTYAGSNGFKNEIASSVAFYKTNFGKEVGNDDGLAEILKDSNAQNAVITVTGYALDITKSTAATIEALKKHATEGTLTSKLDISKEVLDKTNSSESTSTTLTKDVYISYPGAYQCGVTKWSCIAASFSYYLPYDDTFVTKTDSSTSSSNSASGASTSTGANGSTSTSTSTTTTLKKDDPSQFTGTSAAAPQVSAVAALVKQNYDWMTTKQLKETLLTTAYDIGDTGVDAVFGWGALNGIGAVNGPAAFVYGDFEAKLNNNRTISDAKEYGKNYYFNNNIIGDYGLRVSGNMYDYLFLTGQNTYTGTTYVNSGNLVVTSRNYASPTFKDFQSAATIKGDVIVNDKGRLIANNATFYKNVTVNGVAQFNQTYIYGDLTVKPGATLYFDIGDNVKKVSVSGKATLTNSNLKLINSGNYIVTDDSASKRTYTELLTAGSLVGTPKYFLVDNNGLLSASIYKYENKIIADIQAKTPSTAAVSLASSEGLSSSDLDLALAGATSLDALFAQADAITLNQRAQATTSTSAAPTTEELIAAGLAGNTSAEAELAQTGSLNLASTSSLTLSEGEDNLTTSTSSESDSTTSGSATSTDVTTTDTSASTDNSNAANTTNVTLPELNRTDKNTVALAAAIQGLSDKEQTAVLLSNSGTSYPALLQAASNLSRNAVQNFSKATSKYNTAPQGWETYLEAGNSSSHWENSHTQLRGKTNSTDVNVGVTHHQGNYTLGVAAGTGNTSFEEEYHHVLLNSSTAKSYLFQAAATYAQSQHYLGANLAYARHDLDSTRYIASLGTQQAQFAHNLFLAQLNAGLLALDKDGFRLQLRSNLTGVYALRDAFSETPNQDYLSTISLSSEASSKFTAYLNLSADLEYHTVLATLPVIFNMNADTEINLMGKTPNMAFTNGATGKSTFSQTFVTKFGIGAKAQLRPDTTLGINGTWSLSDSWQETQARANLTYRF